MAFRELLLIFDNCEHLVDDLAVLLNTLLLQTPGLRVLCTSREAIHLPGEQRLALEPMETPWPVVRTSVADLFNVDAIRLFTERAATVVPGFTLTAHNVRDVAAICRAVDGIPLAVELAAAQARVFTPREIAERLENDIAFLTNGRAGASRHKTLEEAIAWSEQMLAPDELLLFHRLSIFVQSATLAAIEAVCADATLPRTAILGVLTRLVDKSLVMTKPTGHHMRFMMLATIQRFARAGLTRRGEENALARRHAQWVWNLAREGGKAIYTRESLQWVRRIETEDGNLRQAIEFTTVHDPEVAAEIVSNLAWYWLWRNHIPDALTWTSAILNQPAAATSARVLARVHYTRAMASAWRRDFEGALTSLEKALPLAQSVDDREIIPRILQYYAVSAIYCDNLDLASRILDQIEDSAHHNESALPAVSQFSLRGIIARNSGDIDKSLAIMEKGLHSLRDYGEPFLLSTHLCEVAITHQIQGNIARAETLFRECHELTLRTQNAPLLTRSFFTMAEISQAGGNLSEALDWFEAGLEHLHGQGEQANDAVVRSLAYVACGAGMWALGVSLYTAAGVPWPLGKTLSTIVDTIYRSQLEEAFIVLGDADFGRACREGHYWSTTDALQQGVEALRQSLMAGRRSSHPELQIRMLGQGQVLLDDRVLEMVDWKYAVARDLLFYLIAIGERTREQIVSDFWPDVDPARARNRLNVTVHFLRKALGARRWIVFENNRYRFDPVGPYSCDIDDFYAATALASRIAQRQPEQAIASLDYGVALVRGPFLADVIEGTWQQPLRVAIHRDHQQALLQLANLQIDNGLAQNAVYSLSLALQQEPFAEEIYRTLMRAHLVRKDLVQVMQVYRNLCELLDEEYNASPTQETVAVYEEIVRVLREENAPHGAPAPHGSHISAHLQQGPSL
jgi:predicted ATPase/DNA-binding SARP family transcriptional activator